MFVGSTSSILPTTRDASPKTVPSHPIPNNKQEPSARRQYTQGFPESRLFVGKEHNAEPAQHVTECRVRKRQRKGVSLPKGLLAQEKAGKQDR